MQASEQSQSDRNGRPSAIDEHAPIGSIKALHGAMQKWAPQLTAVAPRGRPFDFKRFSAVVLACAARTPKVILCSYYSLRQSVNAAAELGLELGGVSGEAFLIPYENRKKIEYPNGRYKWITVLEATFIPGYKGFLRLAHESRLFRSIGCDVVLPDDTWEPIRRGPDKLLWGHTQNEPRPGAAKVKIPASRWEKSEERNVEVPYEAEIQPLRGAYAFAKLTDPNADDIVTPIWFERLEAIRMRSKAGKNGPWITDYHEMAKKTAVRNLWKQIPKTDQMRRAEELDQEFDFEDTTKDAREARIPEVVTVEAARSPTEAAKAKTDRVTERVKAAGAQPKAPPPPPSSRPETEPPNHDGDAADPDEGP